MRAQRVGTPLTCESTDFEDANVMPETDVAVYGDASDRVVTLRFRS